MSQEQRIGVARNLIVEAEMLENDARTKRERAYILYPELQKKAAAPKVQKTALIETNTVPVQAKKTPAKRAAKTKPVA
jgi:hypothetical protein